MMKLGLRRPRKKERLTHGKVGGHGASILGRVGGVAAIINKTKLEQKTNKTIVWSKVP